MGIGFSLAGRYSADTRSNSSGPEDWLQVVEAWLDDHAGEPWEGLRSGQDSEGHLAVFTRLHPCAEDLEIIVTEPGRVVASGKTSTAGPGYHIYVCDLLARLGTDLGIAWDEPDNERGTGDETGYFHRGDAAAVETEMLNWLRGMASVVGENVEAESAWRMLSMPRGHSYPHHGPLVTPLGPRDRAWLNAVARDPRRGIDLFPWWAEGVAAPFYLGRALCHLWTDFRWRVPLTEAEGDLLQKIHRDLTRAFRLDPTLPYPWREWQELLDYIEAYFGYIDIDHGHVEPEVRLRASQIPDGPRIGYRRFPVRVDLSGGWSLEIPGALAEAWDDAGSWSAWDGDRTIRFSSCTFTNPDGSKPPAAEALAHVSLPEGEGLEYQGKGIIGRAVFSPYEEDGKQLWQLAARSAIAGGVAVCNIFLHNRAERDWAVATWQSLEHH